MKPILQLASGLDWLTDYILEVCKYATIVVVGLIAGIIFIGVFWRYVLNDPLAWYEETAKYLMLWLVFVASPIVLKRTGHVAIDNLPRMMPERIKYFMYLVVFSGVIFLLYEMAYEGWGLAWNAWPQMPTSIPISFFWIYLSVPVGSVIMILILVEHWLLALAGIIDPERGSVPEFGDAELVHAEEAKLSGE
jgi:TRAP-type C4-dicarboxylate transport system permease small subunit